MAAASPASAAPRASELATPYPPARWRLATAEELEHVLVWAAHVQISHRDVTPNVATFHLPDWRPRSANPPRSREEAHRLAQDVAERLRANPSDFARVARELSDDVASRELGGELGGMSALGFANWPEVLDTLAALADNEVSRVIETEFGFHVFTRRPAPESKSLSGARIIIGYDDAPWLHQYLARWPIPRRSRAEALAIAADLHRQLELHPERFAALVQQHSDHRDALRGGDFGQWSTREVSPWYREIEVLRRLEVGQVAPPLDSPFGVEILIRTPERERRAYAMAALELQFDARAASGEASLTAAREALVGVAAQLGSDPAIFDRERARLCCAGVQTWFEGRGNVLEERALAALDEGEVARTPTVVDTFRISLLQRLAPGPAPAVEAALDLPSPRAANVEWLVTKYGAGSLLPAVNSRARAALRWDAQVEAELEARTAAILEANGAAERSQAFREYQSSLRQLLGTERYSQYERVFEAFLEERLMRPRPPGPSYDPETGVRYHAWPLL